CIFRYPPNVSTGVASGSRVGLSCQARAGRPCHRWRAR
ncbi:MAG: hypothetical protein AVDCRST_MAG64-4098, partial [uncultured Phycisphaerae bacterium]